MTKGFVSVTVGIYLGRESIVLTCNSIVVEAGVERNKVPVDYDVEGVSWN